MTQHKSRNAQSGNMLIYILGAIFLMGILIVIVKGSFQPGTGIDAEKSLIQSSQIRAQGAELERGVRLILQSGRSESDIRFSNSADSAYGVLTPLTTYIAERQVFNAKGGGVEFKVAPTGSQMVTAPWVYTGASNVKGVGTTCIQGSCSELIAVLPDVTKAICQQINNSVGVTNPLGVPPKESSNFEYSNFKFTGSFTYATSLDTTGDYTQYKPEGCFEGGGAAAAQGLVGHYYYYKVLLTR